jgi:hypothetical protein
MLAQIRTKIQKKTMTTSDRKIILELNEHDAMRLLTLIEIQLNEGDKVWRRYWERLAQQVKQGIEQAGSDYHQDTNPPAVSDEPG